MVKTELEYNPYIQETKVRFNGKNPRINSLIEKYNDSVLQDWLQEIPSIFYNEMNGYDFDLEFTGTNKDYEDLVETFRSIGIKDDKVHLVHKNELDSRDVKVKKVHELIAWLSDNPNHRFEYEAFEKKNRDLKDGVYTFLIIQGRNVDTSSFVEKNMSFEYIEDIEQLDNTELSNTPILVCIDDDSVYNLQKNIEYIKNRIEIKDRQVFFSIDKNLVEKEIVRIITDMGIFQPQLVESLDDEKILSYISIYPVTNYIKEFIKFANNEFITIKEEIDEEKSVREQANKVIYEQLDEIEALIVRMKNVVDNINNRDNLSMDEEWITARECVFKNIDKWKEKKTKITKESDANEMSHELCELTKKLFADFVETLKNYYVINCSNITQMYIDWYNTIEYDVDFLPSVNSDAGVQESIITDFWQELLEIKEEEYVVPKEDFFGKLFGSGNQNENKEPVLETSYYYVKWRAFVKELVEPQMNDFIEKLWDRLLDFYNRTAEIYLKHLKESIEEQEACKEKISAQLSDEDKIIEEDLDWCSKVIEQLRIIERG